MRAHEFITEKWSNKYKKSINCSNPKGFSQKAHCAGRKKNEDVAEGSEQKYLWHGSRQKIPMLEPRQSVDTGGAAGSNQNAIYATSDPKVAIAVGGLTTPDSDTAMFPNDPQMVLFSGKIRKGENVYLHKLPFYSPDGKPQFVQGAHDREFYSIPGVKGIKPTEIKAVSVDKYLDLIRKATPADLELRKKNMKEQGVAEDLDENLRKWFKDKWVRFGPDGKIRGDCARDSEKEGKPKCLPRSKAQSLGKKGRATAAARKRREDPNANRSGKAINVRTK